MAHDVEWEARKDWYELGIAALMEHGPSDTGAPGEWPQLFAAFQAFAKRVSARENAELRAEVERLQDRVKELDSALRGQLPQRTVLSEIRNLRAERDKLREAMEKIEKMSRTKGTYSTQYGRIARDAPEAGGGS